MNFKMTADEILGYPDDIIRSKIEQGLEAAHAAGKAEGEKVRTALRKALRWYKGEHDIHERRRLNNNDDCKCRICDEARTALGASHE